MSNGIQLERSRCPELKVLPAHPTARLLTAEDVAALTGLSVETLAQWRSQKRGIPYVKISRNCVRYRQSDLDGWLVERIVRTDADPSDRR
jgi:predicted DNA-binding transcriptional regulator AlpA